VSKVAAEEKKPQSASDFGIYVMRSILKLGLATIPQNFELYYASMGGSHPELAKELDALGPTPRRLMSTRSPTGFLQIDFLYE